MPNSELHKKLERIVDGLECLRPDKARSGTLTEDEVFLQVCHFLTCGVHSSDLSFNVENHPWANCFQRIGCQTITDVADVDEDPSTCADRIYERFTDLKPAPKETPSCEAIECIVAVARYIPSPPRSPRKRR